MATVLKRAEKRVELLSKQVAEIESNSATEEGPGVEEAIELKNIRREIAVALGKELASDGGDDDGDGGGGSSLSVKEKGNGNEHVLPDVNRLVNRYLAFVVVDEDQEQDQDKKKKKYDYGEKARERAKSLKEAVDALEARVDALWNSGKFESVLGEYKRAEQRRLEEQEARRKEQELERREREKLEEERKKQEEQARAKTLEEDRKRQAVELEQAVNEIKQAEKEDENVKLWLQEQKRVNDFTQETGPNASFLDGLEVALKLVHELRQSDAQYIQTLLGLYEHFDNVKNKSDQQQDKDGVTVSYLKIRLKGQKCQDGELFAKDRGTREVLLAAGYQVRPEEQPDPIKGEEVFLVLHEPTVDLDNLDPSVLDELDRFGKTIDDIIARIASEIKNLTGHSPGDPQLAQYLRKAKK